MISPHAKNATMNQVSRSKPSLLPFPLSSTRARKRPPAIAARTAAMSTPNTIQSTRVHRPRRRPRAFASAITSFANRLRHDSACDSSSWIASSGAEPPVALARTSDMTCSS